MDMSRRSFIVSSTAAAAAGAALAQAQAEAQPAPAQPMPAPMPRGFNPSDPALKYELVIAGGEVLDPSLRLRGKRDIGIKNEIGRASCRERVQSWVVAEGGKGRR